MNIVKFIQPQNYIRWAKGRLRKKTLSNVPWKSISSLSLLTINRKQKIQLLTRNEEEAFGIYEGIFKKREYAFKFDHTNPYIIDCGAHIGIPVIFFKLDYPEAKIIAIEPNPKTFQLLEANVRINDLANVDLIQGVVGKKADKVSFYVDERETNPWAWGDTASKALVKQIESGRIRKSQIKEIKVKWIPLLDFIDREVDLLKVDVEGAETDLIRYISKKLAMIKNIVLEFHFSEENPRKNLEYIKETLKNAGFNVTVKDEYAGSVCLLRGTRKK